MIRVKPEALVRMGIAVGAWSHAADAVSRETSAITKRLVEDVQREVQLRCRHVESLEAEMRGARDEVRDRSARELREATAAAEGARRGLRLATEAHHKAQAVTRRTGEATAGRVPRARDDLERSLAALAAFSGPGHARAQLLSMITRAVASNVVDAANETSDQLTAHMPDRVGDPLSAALAVGAELKGNWVLYSHTPEFIMLKVKGGRNR